jgi:hypothetical protein
MNTRDYDTLNSLMNRVNVSTYLDGPKTNERGYDHLFVFAPSEHLVATLGVSPEATFFGGATLEEAAGYARGFGEALQLARLAAERKGAKDFREVPVRPAKKKPAKKAR